MTRHHDVVISELAHKPLPLFQVGAPQLDRIASGRNNILADVFRISKISQHQANKHSSIGFTSLIIGETNSN